MQTLEEAGIAVAVILYDDVEALAAFQMKYDISYHLLSDPGSEVIQQYRILNPTYDTETKYYGVPYPGVFLTDRNGVVRAKFAEQNYRDRPLFKDIVHAARELSHSP